MKNSKGSKKDFARYIQSEIDDDYLEPLENSQYDLPESKAKKCSCKTCKHCIERIEKKQSLSAKKSSSYYYNIRQSYSPYPYTNNNNDLKAKAIQHEPTKALTDQTIKNCVSNLGKDAQNCYYGLQEFKTIHVYKDTQIFEKFKDLYSSLKTLPILYLSIAYSEEENNEAQDVKKIKAVYVWQMNKMCPCIKGENEQQLSMMTDVKSHTINKRQFPSILVLAKIVPEVDEEIIGAKLLGNNKLLLQSSSATIPTEVIYKIYNITDFEVSARVNPLEQNILANSLYAWKLKIHSQENTV